MRREWVCRGPAVGLMVVIAGLLASLTVQAETSPALDHPAVQEVVAMAEAGLSEELIFERIRRIAEFPELTGQDLAELKQRGVPEGILIHMVRMGPRSGSAAFQPAAVEAVRPQQAPPPRPAEPAAALGEAGESRVRVVIDRSIPITYYEVMVDGEVVASGGTLWQGRAEPGAVLERPRLLAGEDRFTALDTAVEPGTHAIKAGFAISAVSGGTVEEYVTEGVLAVGSGLGNDRGGSPNLGAMCAVAPGQICAVTATFDRRTPGRPGIPPEYGIGYTVNVLE